MRTAMMAILTLTLMAGPRQAPVKAQVSRIENRTDQPWKLTLDKWVAGAIRIRQAGAATGAASLEREGAAYVIGVGQAIEMTVQSTRNCLALELVLSRMDGTGPAASIYISQGNPGDPHTLNINDAPSVRVERTFYGHSGTGAFVQIR